MAEEEKEQEDAWVRSVLGDNKHLRPLFDSAENAATVNKEVLALLKTQYEAGKILALAAINPVFLAIHTFIDLIDKGLQDLAKSGYYTLGVNSSTMKKAENTKPATFGTFFYSKQKSVPAYRDYNNELVGSIRGQTVPDHPPYGKPSSDENTYPVVEDGSLHAQDFFGSYLYKLVPNYEESPSSVLGVKTDINTGLIQVTPSDIITTMLEAFEDTGDLKQEFLDKNNNSVTSADKADIDPVTLKAKFRYVDNKPTFSKNSKVGGVILIIGASTITEFSKLIHQFNEFFKVPEIDDLIHDLSKIMHIPEVTVKVRDVHLIGRAVGDPSVTTGTSIKQGNFTQWVSSKKKEEHLVLIEQSPNGDSSYTGFVGEVIKVNSQETPKYIGVNNKNEKVNTNLLPYVNEEVVLQPLTNIRKPTPGNNLIQAEIDTNTIAEIVSDKVSTLLDISPSSKLKKDSDSEEMDLSDKKWKAIKPKSGGEFIFACKVRHNNEKPPSKPPNFTSKTLSDLIPGLGSFVRDMRSKLNYYRGIVTTAANSIQPTIDAIEKRVKKAEDISNTIISIQEQFAALRNVGLYALYLDPQLGGTEKFKTRLESAVQKPPNTLKFCAGFMIVAGSPDSQSGEAVQLSYDTIKSLLGGK